MNPQDWNKEIAAACIIELLQGCETPSQLLIATLDFVLELHKDGCDIQVFRPIIEAHAIACKQHKKIK